MSKLCMKNEKQSRILERERLIEEVKKLTLFDDIFMSAVLEDIPACQHVLRILTGISDLNIRTVKSQYHITKLVSKRSRLDIFAESTDNQIYIIEVQKEDKGNHSKRVRYFTSVKRIYGIGEARFIPYINIWEIPGKNMRTGSTLFLSMQKWTIILKLQS